MKIFKNASQNSIKAYHGSNKLFNKFDTIHTAQGILWFSEDLNDILSGNSGALSSKYIYEVQLNVSNPAGWEEYDKLYLDQIRQQGFDSIHLYDNWVIFEENRVKIDRIYENKDSKLIPV